RTGYQYINSRPLVLTRHSLFGEGLVVGSKVAASDGPALSAFFVSNSAFRKKRHARVICATNFNLAVTACGDMSGFIALSFKPLDIGQILFAVAKVF
ncbi:MAG: hypothetical protein KAV83_11245, partial [Desulfobacterales bacterium]|nr:hypothetical protein [Desulfobacterales bacterium]